MPLGRCASRRRTSSRRLPVAARAAVTVLAIALPGAATTHQARAESADPATTLALRYAPVVRLVAQPQPCAHGEPFEPIDVNLVLGNPEVALRGPWDGNNIVKVAPTAADLSKGLFGYHLDFPGNALNPGCTYDEWSRRLTSGSKPVVYARVVTEAGHAQRLALQYWLFYVFNDFNDKHEGDWEMIQLDFDAGSAASALTMKPSLVGYSQHEGAESAHWGDEKLTVVGGTHPVVYAALGSHANYFAPGLYLGRSAAQGVGCDDTFGPSRELHPAVEVIPTKASAYLREYPWLGFDGFWGEEHAGFYNGPTGPNTKPQWSKPITWADEHWRDTSFAVPAGSALGSTATGFFCGAVAAGSSVLTRLVGDPSPVLIVLAVVLVLLLWLASRTRWSPSSPFRIRRRRTWGSIVTTSARMYRSHLSVFLGIGLLFVPLGLLITAVQYAVFRVGGLAPLVDSAGPSNAFVVLPAIALGAFFTVVGLAIVQATTALAMVELDAGRPVGALGAYRLAGPRLAALLGALGLAGLAVAVADVFLIGAIVGAWLVVRFGLIAPIVALEGAGWHAALRRSARLVRGSFWRTASLTVFVGGVSLLLGPLVGSLLLFATSASFDFINLVSSVVYAIVLPYVAIATTYLYLDLRVAEHLSRNADPLAGVLPAEA